MAVAVAKAAGDNGPLRRYAGKELRASRGDAAVMSHLEERALEGQGGNSGLGDHSVFDWAFSIAF